MSQKARLRKLIEDYVISQGWNYESKENTVIFNMNIKSKLSKCRVYVVAYENGIGAIAVCPLNATKDVYNTVVEYITRANYGLKCGGFEFDYSDGEIRYRTFLSAREALPDMQDVEHIVDLSFFMMQQYGDGLIKSLMGFGDPERDIEAAEA